MKDFDIEFPPLPFVGGLRTEEFEKAMRLWAEKAVLADRERRGKPAAIVRSVTAGKKGVSVLWLAGPPQIGDRLYFSPQPSEPDVLPGEAIFGFAAWLTCLKTPVTFSECHGAALGADLAAAYNASQGFDQVREDFHKRLKPGPTEPGPSQHFDDVVEPSLSKSIDQIKNEIAALLDEAGRQGVKIQRINAQFASTVCGQFRLISMDVDEHRLGTGKKGEDS